MLIEFFSLPPHGDAVEPRASWSVRQAGKRPATEPHLQRLSKGRSLGCLFWFECALLYYCYYVSRIKKPGFSDK